MAQNNIPMTAKTKNTNHTSFFDTSTGYNECTP